MTYVYILRSVKNGKFYTGVTSDLRRRFLEHNASGSAYTGKFQPWKLVWYGAFADRALAERFESYLKTGSGWAYSRKRLVMV